MLIMAICTTDEPIPMCARVERYCHEIKEKYRRQRIVNSDWPPRVGESYFGRLVLLEANDTNATPKAIRNKQWCMLRGDIDQVCEHTKDKRISVYDVLKPNENGQPLRVVVDGPPGIGKTTLCRKLLNMWAEEKLKQYGLVLYCPLRNTKAVEIKELFINHYYGLSDVIQWIESTDGHRLLIIFDGWDELSIKLREKSLAAKIIGKEKLPNCSVIVTSRSCASSSLLKLDPISKHVEVIGFSKQEFNNVVQNTLTPPLANKLIKQIEIRNDIQSLCYIPLVCSIFVYVCKSLEGQLPTTLTELYEEFILQTIKRHVEVKQLNMEIDHLYNLPSKIYNIFLKLSEIAYLSLKENPPKLTFSFSEFQSLSNLGLMTMFAEYGYGKKTYQFLHLSIQEFLAAWWITKSNTNELFEDHFYNDHFRLCLRFVAGLTHLEQESYQAYFQKPLDFQCKMKPMFSYDAMYLSWFNKRPDHLGRTTVNLFYDHLDTGIFLLQLLYESQNTKLCPILAKSMNNKSLCLHESRLSSFDILCLSYFLNNSNTTWNFLHFGALNELEVQIITDTVTNNSQCNQCKGLQVVLDDMSPETTIAFLQLPFLRHIEHCSITTTCRPQNLYSVLCNLHQLQKLYISWLPRSQYSVACVPHQDLQQFIKANTTIHQLEIYGSLCNELQGNDTFPNIQYLSLHDELAGEVIKQLLKSNCTLKALEVQCKTSLNVQEVSTSLQALALRSHGNEILSILKMKEMKSLVMNFPFSNVPQYPHSLLHCLFQSHSSLQLLYIKLETSKSVNELFTILQSNTTLKALRMELDGVNDLDRSLQDMLQHNNSLQYFHILPPDNRYDITKFGSDKYLCYLSNGISDNIGLEELRVPIPLSSNCEKLNNFFDDISQKTKITNLTLNYVLNKEGHQADRKAEETNLIKLCYEFGLPLVTRLLLSHPTIKLLKLVHNTNTFDVSVPFEPVITDFYNAAFDHPSLEYVEMIVYDNQILKNKLNRVVEHRKPKRPIINCKF